MGSYDHGSMPPPPELSSYPSMPPPRGWQQPRNGLGVAALVLGILSIIPGVVMIVVGVVLGILAIIFGVIGIARARRGEATNRGMAIAGLVCGAVGFALSAVFLLGVVAVGMSSRGSVHACVAPSTTHHPRPACVRRYFPL
jgi:hypothetical protein